MKKLAYTLLGICLHLFALLQIQAQTCDSDFTVNTEITNSTCLSNGEIKVTLSGNTANLSNIQYGLSSTNGFIINPQGDNILRNIPPGTYELTVRAFCKTDSNIDVYKNVSNIVIGGDYKVPQVSFNADESRKSYSGCNTGIIALNVKDGNGNFTFKITSAPAGVATPKVVVTTKKGNVYILPGQNYPAGNYTIQIEDGCYTSVKEFTLGTVSGFPQFDHTGSNGYLGFSPDLDNKQGSCGYLYWRTFSSDNYTNQDYQRYSSDNMYEVGAAPAGQMPTHWTLWNYYGSLETLLNISPYNISDFYTPNSIAIFTRVKGCENVYTSFTTNISKPRIYIIQNKNTCDNNSYSFHPASNYEGMLCYPLSVKVENNKTGNVIYDKSNWLYYPNSRDSLNLDYDTDYKITMVDQNGTVVRNSLSTYVIRSLHRGLDKLRCDSYTIWYNLRLEGIPYECFIPAKVTMKDPDGTIIQEVNFNDSKTVAYSPPLEYGKIYTMITEYIDGDTRASFQIRNSDLPTSYTLNLNYNSYKCKVNTGGISIEADKDWPVGTTFTITGPEGFTTINDTTISSHYFETYPQTYLPPGDYTLTVNHGCGTPIVVKYKHLGVYDYNNFGFDSQNTCSGLKVTPKGTMTYNGQPITTYFRLAKGPDGGYDKSVILSGGSFTFSAPGTYVLRILKDDDMYVCGIKDTTIVYTASPFDIDPYATSGYVCAGETVGNITVKTINGVPPYTYELWDKTNTVKENIGNITTDGSAHFVYGKSNETYTVRITDQCGSKINQQIKVVNLSDAGLAYTPNNNLCSGDTIRLNSVALSQTTYNWTGPNNFSSAEQNPQIVNISDHMTGWYKVLIKPEFCDNPVKDSVYIQVGSPLTAGEVISDQSVCVRATPPVLTCQTIGASSSCTYKWQKSEDGISGWTDIPDATGETYQPPVLLESGINYYRKISSNKCSTVYSDPITLTTKSCFIPVNPSLRNMGHK